MDTPKDNSHASGLHRLLEKDPMAFLDAVPLAMFLLDRSGCVVGANSRAVSLLSPPTSGPPPHWTEVFRLPPSADLVRVVSDLLRSPGSSVSKVVTLSDSPAAADAAVEVSALSFPSENEEGPDGFLFFLREIPSGGEAKEGIERQEGLEEALRRERSWFEQLMNTVPDKIYFKDLESRFLRISLTQAEQFGLETPSAAIGRSDFDFFVKSHAETTREEEREIMQTGRPLVGKVEKLTLHDGKKFWASTSKVPLRGPDRRVEGIVGISRDITRQKEAEEALRAKNEEMHTDLKMAYEIQKAFFTLEYPRFPAGVEADREVIGFGHRYLPVETLGGDFFEIFRISDDQAGILVCDVMGHGVRAALLTAFLRGLVDELQSRWQDPGGLLEQINRGMISVLRRADALMFVTAFYAVADAKRGELRYANAGHPSPFLLRRQRGLVERVTASASGPEPAIGLVDQFPYTSGRVPLDKGDLALFFTDGLIEVENSKGEFFGEHVLQKVLEQSLHFEADSLLDKLVADARSHAEGNSFKDDLCLVTAELPDRELS